jgi:DNA gyrase subunit A
MGRDAAGVRGVRLGEGQRVIALLVLGEGYVLTASENGYGKLTSLEDFPGHGRGAQGVIALQTTYRNGATVAALQVQPGDELMLISSTGTLVRTPVADISVVGRNTQGVRLIRLGEAERLTGVERVAGLEPGDDSAAIDSEGNDQNPDSTASGDEGGSLGDGGSDEVSPL